MKFDHLQSYDGNPKEVFAVLSDQDYVEAKCWATGATEAGVSVETDGDSVEIRTVRTLPAKLPSYAKKFVGEQLEVDQTETWGPAAADGSRDGTIALTFTGTPMKVTGTMRLDPTDDGATVRSIGEIKAGIPLVGGKIEKFAADQIGRGLDVEARTANERLS